MPSIDDSPTGETPFRSAVDRSLTAFVAARRAVFEPLGPDVEAFVEAALAFAAGGKHLRPLFCRAGWLVAGGLDGDASMVRAAAALEWLQASALVHDDLMDGSDTRRGRPSVHRLFEGLHRDEARVGDAAWFGESTAVLMGDLHLSWATEMLTAAALDVGPERGRRAIEQFDLCKAEVAAGQFLDVAGQTKGSLDAEEAMVVVRYKSAKYTVERPLHIGAALAGADDALLGALSRAALPLGSAFQLRDDVLGVFGDPEVTGKPAGDDLREGKRTVLVARAMERLDESSGRQLLEALGTHEGVDVARRLIEDSGALQAVETDIAELEAQTDAAIADLGPGAAEVLRPLALRATRRAR